MSSLMVVPTAAVMICGTVPERARRAEEEWHCKLALSPTLMNQAGHDRYPG